jgi:hypothetical protein
METDPSKTTELKVDKPVSPNRSCNSPYISFGVGREQPSKHDNAARSEVNKLHLGFSIKQFLDRLRNVLTKRLPLPGTQLIEILIKFDCEVLPLAHFQMEGIAETRTPTRNFFRPGDSAALDASSSRRRVRALPIVGLVIDVVPCLVVLVAKAIAQAAKKVFRLNAMSKRI